MLFTTWWQEWAQKMWAKQYQQTSVGVSAAQSVQQVRMSDTLISPPPRVLQEPLVMSTVPVVDLESIKPDITNTMFAAAREKENKKISSGTCRNYCTELAGFT